MMFGPPTRVAQLAELMRWGIKKYTNDELRQRFVNLTVPQAQAVGLTLPDPALRHNAETGDWEFGAIDWDEFWAVVKGDGPCNQERLEARNRAHREGEWVRAAATAYAAKRARADRAAA
jgi:ring-1,2-phenylacetyl-CoA epoxidase subunit PaaA